MPVKYIMEVEYIVNLSKVKLGFYSAMTAFVAMIGYDVVQILQVLGYTKYPLDVRLIFGFSLLIPIPFILAMLALHYSTDEDRRIWTHAALIFTAIYASYVSLNYVVQLTTVVPMTLQGALNDIRVLDQTPHSLFWDVDALGYICMGLATLFAAVVFENQGIERWTRWFFLANALITPVIMTVYFYPTFSIPLLIILGSPWLITSAGSMLFLALYFKQKCF